MLRTLNICRSYVNSLNEEFIAFQGKKCNIKNDDLQDSEMNKSINKYTNSTTSPWSLWG